MGYSKHRSLWEKLQDSGVDRTMCLTMGPARLSKTVLYSAEAMVGGRLVHVLGYQNAAENLTRGPNAMVLPFPASAPMGPENIVDTSSCKSILSDYANLFVRRTRGLSKGMHDSLSDSRRVQVFDSGRYTIVLAEDARSIPSALSRVPENKRPALNPEVFEAYAKWYPKWPIALCCFEQGATVEPEPMLWWYEPINPHTLFAPALDGHDGGVPQLGVQVAVDHTVVFGSLLKPGGMSASFRDTVSPEVKQFLAPKVWGEQFKGSAPNGDFCLNVSDFQRSELERVFLGSRAFLRVLPPGA